jgi:hypothetical protein
MDVKYIPRRATIDPLFGEDNTSYFDQFVTIEMYFESKESFGGADDFMSKLGLRTTEEAVFRVAKRRWEELIGSTGITQNSIRPNEGDLLWVPFDQNLFEIRKVSLKDPFYQLNDFYSYTLTCSLFQYGSESITADIPEMQDQLPTSLDNLLYPSIVGVGENLTIDPTTQELATAGITTVDYNTANKDIHTDAAAIQSFSESNPFGLSGQ